MVYQVCLVLIHLTCIQGWNGNFATYATIPGRIVLELFHKCKLHLFSSIECRFLSIYYGSLLATCFSSINCGEILIVYLASELPLTVGFHLNKMAEWGHKEMLHWSAGHCRALLAGSVGLQNVLLQSRSLKVCKGDSPGHNCWRTVQDKFSGKRCKDI